MPGTPASPAAFVPFTAPGARPSGTSLPIVVRMSAGRIPDPELIRVRLQERFPQDRLTVESVAGVFAARTDRAQFLAVLFGTLAGITLLLAAIGVYAVAAFETVRRRHDMAIRLALGSSSRQLRYGVLREVLTPVIVGTAGGLMAAWIAVRTFQAQWVDLEAVGLSAYVVAGALVLVATLSATWLPTRAALRINPAVELQRS